MKFFRGKVIPGSRLGLSTSCSRFSKKFPVIFQKIAQTLLKKQWKVVFWSDTKICKLHNKSNISRTNLKQEAHIHPPTAWPVPDAWAQPYHHANEGEAATARVMWLCACVRYWPVGGLVKVCPLL